jgi:hypothetical protein
MAYTKMSKYFVNSMRANWTLLIAGLSQLVIISLLWSQNLVLGSIEGNFFYPYIKYQRRLDLMIALIVLSIFFIFKKKIYRALSASSKQKEFLIVCATFALGTVVEMWMRSRYPFSMTAVIRDLNANGFYSAALQTSFSQILQNFSEFASQFPSVHVQANMPGKTLFYKLIQIITIDPGTIGFLIIVISNLTSIIIFYISKVLFQDRLIAWSALLLCLFTPAKIQFQPILNTVSPVLIYFSLLLIILCAKNNIKGYGLLAGIILFLQFVFDPVPFGLGLIFLGLLIVFCIGKKFQSKFFSIVSSVIIGFLGSGVIFYALTGFNLIEGFLYCLKDAAHFNISNRPYGIWIIQNLKEYVIGAGLASSLILFISLLKSRSVNWSDHTERNANVTLIIFLATILILNFSGANRGEVTRLWIFLTPIQALLTAYFCHKIYSQDGYLVPLGASFIQASISITSIGFVLVS